MIIKDIAGFEGLYKVTDTGEIFSIDRIVITSHGIVRNYKGKVLKSKNLIGYRSVCLSNDKVKKKTILVHRILAEAFLPNPDKKPCVNHKNGIKDDNNLDNLEWCTYSENMQHAYDNNLNYSSVGGDNSKAKLIIDTTTGIYYDCVREAAEGRGFTRSQVSGGLFRFGHFRGLTYA